MNRQDPVAIHAPASVTYSPEALAPERARWVDPRAALRPTIRAFRAKVAQHVVSSRTASVLAKTGETDGDRAHGQSQHASERATLRALQLVGGFLRGREYARMEGPSAGLGPEERAALAVLPPEERSAAVANHDRRLEARKAAFRGAAAHLSAACTADPELAGHLAACGVVGEALPADEDTRAQVLRRAMAAWRDGTPLGVKA